MSGSTFVPPQPTALSVSVEELDLVDWNAPAVRPLEPIRARRRVARPSALVRTVASVHASTLTPATAVADFAVTALVVTLVGVTPWWWSLALPLVLLTSGYVTNAYRDRDTVQTRGVLWHSAQMLVPVLAVGGVSLAARVTGVSGAVFLSAATAAGLTALRCLTWVVLVACRRRGLGLRSTLIVGDAEAGALLWRRLVEFPEAGLTPTQLIGYDIARAPGALDEQLSEYAVEHVVLVTPGVDDGLLASSLPRHDADAPFFSVVPALSELFLDPRSVCELGGIPLIPLGRVTRAQRRFPGKRALDVLIASVLLLAGLPLLAAIAVAIKCGDGGPVFYRQHRVGRHGTSFGMLKFRTMVVGADRMLASLREDNISDGLLFKLRDDPRVTKVGRVLRRTSLDELPQLWNVLVGTMSLVGPRPLPVAAEDFEAAAAERHTVLPGITGYWQLSGGPELSYDEMVRLDLAYIRNWSLWLDLRLILRTVPAMAHRHGAG
jgi:exopolysaccharide biosynthesis polyprenyl glycosylphosphotransferase